MGLTKSFSDAIKQESERFVSYAFQFNPKIKDFNDFQESFMQVFSTPNGKNAKIDSQDLIQLFESPSCKRKISFNVNEKEYDQLYGDGLIVERESINKKKIIEIRGEKEEIKRGDKTYTRIKPKVWTNAESKFIMVRKEKGKKPSEVYKEYNSHFENNPRTKKSLYSKYYKG